MLYSKVVYTIIIYSIILAYYITCKNWAFEIRLFNESQRKFLCQVDCCQWPKYLTWLTQFFFRLGADFGDSNPAMAVLFSVSCHHRLTLSGSFLFQIWTEKLQARLGIFFAKNLSPGHFKFGSKSEISELEHTSAQALQTQAFTQTYCQTAEVWILWKWVMISAEI